MKPTIIFTSVIRGAKMGEMHGGIYLLNLKNKKYKCVLDWNDGRISFQGRGGDRGLRGICFHNGLTYVAASNELFAFNHQWQIVNSYTNPYLKDCHEISCCGDSIFLASTGTNSILEFNASEGRFVSGHKLFKINNQRELFHYNPNDVRNYESMYRFGGDHINNVFCIGGKVYFSGLHTLRLFAMDIQDRKLEIVSKIPQGTHNVRPYRSGYLMNITSNDVVVFMNRHNDPTRIWPIKTYPDKKLTGLEHIGIARQGFGRGLCVHENLIFAGSSPTTISTYNFDTKKVKTTMILSDIRNAIHGLEVWPFKTPQYLC
jgi:hypothetical protein